MRGTFSYPFAIQKRQFLLQEKEKTYDLKFEGESFNILYERIRRKEKFNWDNKNKHDPYEARHYGEKLTEA